MRGCICMVVACALVATTALGVRLQRAPSKMQQLAAEGVLQETLLAFEVRKALALAANESQPQTDQYNVRSSRAWRNQRRHTF